MNSCQHMEFECSANINRLENDTGDPMQFQADIRIKCVNCGEPFKFIGLPYGVDLNGAAVSADGLEGRFAIAPKDRVLAMTDSWNVGGFTIRKAK